MEETVKNRLDIYKSATEPIIGYYEKSKHPLYVIDGSGTIEATYESIIKSLGEKL
jgi:adenylate kinase family enzyme